MAGLRPMFTLNSIKENLQAQTSQYEDKVVKALQYEGEAFVRRARLKSPAMGSFRDRTGNLRSSIGYIILKNGQQVAQNFDGKTAQGQEVARQIASEVASRYRQGIVLIGVAGMSYAAAVEAKGYDVITGSAPGSNEIKNLLGAIKF